ncbi:MAG: DUF1801 domain-containing protein [Bacteroidota bacterium]
MQHDTSHPEAYLTSLDNDWRKKTLEEIRALILNASPGVHEYIEYKMLAYGEGDKAVFHLNAQKNYVSLYVGDSSAVDPSGELLKGLDLGKGCIRFKKTVQVTDTRIEEFIHQAIALSKSGKDIGC